MKDARGDGDVAEGGSRTTGGGRPGMSEAQDLHNGRWLGGTMEAWSGPWTGLGSHNRRWLGGAMEPGTRVEDSH